MLLRYLEVIEDLIFTIRKLVKNAKYQRCHLRGRVLYWVCPKMSSFPKFDEGNLRFLSKTSYILNLSHDQNSISYRNVVELPIPIHIGFLCS